MDAKKIKKLISYGGLLLACLAFAAYAIGVIPQAVAFGIMGICGYGAGVTALRARIESFGLKSTIVGIAGAILSILLLFKVIDIATFTSVSAALGTLLGIALNQAVSKAGS